MIKRIFIKFIHFYQVALSPYKKGPTCRFYPSCSCYGIEAIEKHGVIKGGLFLTWRLLRCNPFSKGGYDPVPEKIQFKKITYPR